MKNSVPSKYSDKTILFTEMFGSKGDILDPYDKGYSTYLEVFKIINSLIEEYIEWLFSLLNK